MKKSGLARRKSRSHIGLHIFMSLYCFILAVPLWYLFNNTFKDKATMHLRPYYILPGDFTFDNIIKAYNLVKFPMLFKNSMIYLLVSCAIMVALGAAAGFAIGTVRNRFTRITYTAIVLCITIPFQLYMIPIVIVLQKIGLYSSYLGTCVTFAVTSMPFVVFIYSGFMRTIPHEIYEAATVDGASPFGILVQVYLPLLKTVTGTVLILRGLGVWNSVLIPLVTVGSPNRRALIHGVYTFCALNVTDWGLVFGASLLMSLPITILFLLMQKTFIKGLTAGSVKG